MAKIERVSNVLSTLAKLLRSAKDADASVSVGYTASYAIYVHENLTARHAPGKQAKYLVGPMRLYRAELSRVVRTVVKRTGSVKKGLVMAGLRLQRESMKVVPIDTGNLRASAFTRDDLTGGNVS